MWARLSVLHFCSTSGSFHMWQTVWQPLLLWDLYPPGCWDYTDTVALKWARFVFLSEDKTDRAGWVWVPQTERFQVAAGDFFFFLSEYKVSKTSLLQPAWGKCLWCFFCPCVKLLHGFVRHLHFQQGVNKHQGRFYVLIVFHDFRWKLHHRHIWKLFPQRKNLSDVQSENKFSHVPLLGLRPGLVPCRVSSLHENLKRLTERKREAERGWKW